MEKPLINNSFLLQKYPGKGGWTYVALPIQKNIKKKAYGMVKVKGGIDGFEFKGFHLMPMKTGELFLPVRSEIRKKIKKEAGDTVKIILFEDHDSFEFPLEFLTCLKDDPKAEQQFYKWSEAERIYYIKWIYAAKKEETRIDRMALSIQRMSKNLKFAEKEK